MAGSHTIQTPKAKVIFLGPTALSVHAGSVVNLQLALAYMYSICVGDSGMRGRASSTTVRPGRASRSSVTVKIDDDNTAVESDRHLVALPRLLLQHHTPRVLERVQ